MKVRIKHSPKRQQPQMQPQQGQQIGYPTQDPTQQQQGQEQPQEGQEQQQFALGGTNNYSKQVKSPYFSLDLGHYPFDQNRFQEQPFDFNSGIKEVPREQATLEAERGETLTRKLPDGTLTQFNIGGKPHSQGGTPLEGKSGDFIFSQTKSMAIGGPILSLFGKNGKGKKKYVPADLAKQYDINKYQAMLADPNSDALQKKTAEMMVAKLGGKLQELAEVQEMKKGNPQGSPQIARYGGLLKAQTGRSIVNGLYDDVFDQNEYGISQQPITKQIIVKHPITGKPVVIQHPVSNNEVDTTKHKLFKFNPHENEVAPEEAFSSTGLPSLSKPVDNYAQTLNELKGYSKDNNTYSQEDKGNGKTPQYSYPWGMNKADQNSIMSAMMEQIGVPRASISMVPRPQFTKSVTPDNSAELAALQSQANAGKKYMGMTMDGSRARANDLSSSGDEMNGVAKSFGDMRSQITQTQARDAERADLTFNKYNQDVAGIRTQQSMLARQQQAEENRAKNAKDQNIAQADQQGFQNAYKVGWQNMQTRNQGFGMDPYTYQPIFHANYNSSGNSGTHNPEDYLKQQIAVFKAAGYTDDAARAEAAKSLHQFRHTQTMNMFNMKKNNTRDSSNPMTQYQDDFGTGVVSTL